jgi:hypothetical protein
MPSAENSIIKLMAATPAEFARGMERLTGDMTAKSFGAATEIELPGGSVRISYTPREGRRLSPLLVMPAADVTFAFAGVTNVDQVAFIAKFDQVFQRGGG